METNQRLSTLFSFVMIVATATLGWFTLKDASGPRVGDNRFLTSLSSDEQDVPARLWEDPLQAVLQAAAKGGTTSAPAASQPVAGDKHTLQALKNSLRNELDRREICLLVVPIPDTPYPDDIETRLRLRYSIQMALADRDYAPASNSYLGYLRLGETELTTDRTQLGALVPYELFQPRKAQQAGGTNIKEVSILVLWMPESRLARSPLKLLADLGRDLIGPDYLTRLSGIFVIGPRSSDTLKVLIREATSEQPLAGAEYLKDKLAIFSSQATAPDGVIELKAYSHWNRAREDLARALHNRITGKPESFGAAGSWRYFYNFIATDDQLTDLIAAELIVRGIEPGRDSILVLAEADTAYGRSLPIALQASLDTSLDPRPYRAGDPSFWTPTPQRIATVMSSQPREKNPAAAQPLLTYRYLRGLDQQKGQAQNNDKSAARTAPKTPDELLALALSKQGAMALGESQLDYVDRLVSDIESHSLKRNAIRAVGVLGGDIYDKLILLRSLRPRFPDAVFFTTDLDARLWHPDHLRFTRNVVVASATDVRGLESGLNPAQIPPFRDTYQVTMFNACRSALTLAVRSAEARETAATLPAIFEIGRDGPRMLESFVSVEPQVRWPEFHSRSTRAFIVILCGLLLAILLYAINYRSRPPQFSPLQSGIGVAICAIIAFSILAHYQFPARLGGEPWALHEGISVWPTEILRLTIICVVLASFAGAWQHHCEFRQKLARRYDLDVPPLADGAAPLPLHRRLRRWFARAWTQLGGRQNRRELAGAAPAARAEEAETHVATELFADYVRRGQPVPRAVRVLAATAAYLVIAFALMFFLHGSMPPNTHIRGDFARGLDKGFLIASISCFLAFVFYVLDAVFITALLLDKIKLRTVWPAKLLAAKQRQFRVRDEELDGFLDVGFAAEISADIGRLIYLPFIIQFLFILSRNSYFDNWSWPAALIAVFAGNFTLACVAWGVLRYSAREIRQSALQGLKEALRSAGEEAASGRERTRHKDLLKMRKLVEDEERGAYARVFQDPALLAMLLPSGVFGIVVILCRALFSNF